MIKEHWEFGFLWITPYFLFWIMHPTTYLGSWAHYPKKRYITTHTLEESTSWLLTSDTGDSGILFLESIFELVVDEDFSANKIFNK